MSYLQDMVLGTVASQAMFSVRPAARSEHATETALLTASPWLVPAAELHMVRPWNWTQTSQVTLARPIVEYTMNTRSATKPTPITIFVVFDTSEFRAERGLQEKSSRVSRVVPTQPEHRLQRRREDRESCSGHRPRSTFPCHNLEP